MRIALILNGFSLGIKKDVLSINDKVLNSRKKSLKKLLIYEYIGIKINFYVKKMPKAIDNSWNVNKPKWEIHF